LPTILQGGSEFSGLRLPRLKRLLIGLDRRRDLQLTSMIAISQTVKERYAEAGFAPDAIEVLPHGLPLPDVERRDPPSAGGELRLLFVARLVPEKGAHLLLERLAQLAAEPGRRRIQCDLVGPPGPPKYMRRLRELLGAPGLRDSVRLVGPVPREEALRLYAQYDAVVVPSMWREPFGLVLPEALAAGTAVVASRSLGAAEWFEDGRELLLFSPERPWELDEALRRLRDEPGLAGRLAEAGCRKARVVFDRATFLDRMETHLERAVGRPKLSSLLSERRRLARPLSPATESERRAA
jgi:glycosyltransferase involved in cell wall biosynthesis